MNFNLAKLWGADQLEQIQKDLKVAQKNDYKQLLTNATFQTSVQLQILSDSTKFIGVHISKNGLLNKQHEKYKIIKRMPRSQMKAWHKPQVEAKAGKDTHKQVSKDDPCAGFSKNVQSYYDGASEQAHL